jgi:hypothetical protein
MFAELGHVDAIFCRLFAIPKTASVACRGGLVVLMLSPCFKM